MIPEIRHFKINRDMKEQYNISIVHNSRAVIDDFLDIEFIRDGSEIGIEIKRKIVLDIIESVKKHAGIDIRGVT